MNESNTTTNTIRHIDQSRLASTRPQGCVDAQDRLNVPKNEHDRIVLARLHMSQLVIAEAGVLAQRRGWTMSKVVQEAVEHYIRCDGSCPQPPELAVPRAEGVANPTTQDSTK